VTASFGGEGAPRVLRVVTMLRAAALICVVVLMQGIALRSLLEHPARWSACLDDDGDGGCSLIGDESLAARRVVVPEPPSPRQSRWHGSEVSVPPSPAPDEILHVPRQLLA